MTEGVHQEWRQGGEHGPSGLGKGAMLHSPLTGSAGSPTMATEGRELGTRARVRAGLVCPGLSCFTTECPSFSDPRQMGTSGHPQGKSPCCWWAGCSLASPLWEVPALVVRSPGLVSWSR